VAVEVFEGNTADPMTLAAQIDKLKGRFGLSRVVLVGDRGMITSARIRPARGRRETDSNRRSRRRQQIFETVPEPDDKPARKAKLHF
jgi:hypothetical protein